MYHWLTKYMYTAIDKECGVTLHNMATQPSLHMYVAVKINFVPTSMSHATYVGIVV